MYKHLDAYKIGNAEISAKKLAQSDSIRVDIHQNMIGVSFVVRLEELRALRDYLNRAVKFAEGVDFIPEDTRVRVIETGEIGTVQSVKSNGTHYVMIDGNDEDSQEEPTYRVGFASSFAPI